MDDNWIIWELTLSITEEGHLSYCMCSDLSLLGMHPNQVQKNTMLNSLNNFNNKTHKKSISEYHMPSYLVTPHMFDLLGWMKEEGKVSPFVETKTVKKYYSFILVYLNELHEKGTSPLSVGLRALLVGKQKTE